MSVPTTSQRWAAREIPVKSTDIPWADEIPSHWRVMSVKRLARRGRKTFTDGDWIESPYITDSGVRLIQTGNVGVDEYHEQGFRYISEESFKALGCTAVEAGDILICRLGEPLACACLAPQLPSKMITSVDVCILKVSADHDAGYVVKLMSSPRYLGWVNSLCRGSTRDRISRSMLGAFLLPIPPFSEQLQIAAYLDEATGKIDRLVALRRRQMELLREQRAALIQKAVTRGLNPKCALKDSGLPWLGQIPKHWRVERNKVIFREIDLRSSDGSEELLTVSHITGVTPRAHKGEVNMFLAESNEGYKRVEIGELAINTMWAWMGALGFSKYSGIVSPSYNVYRFRQSADANPNYFEFLFRSPNFIKEVIRYSTGVWESRLRLYPEAFFEIRSPIPPVEEQKQIVEYIERITGRTENILSAYNRQLDLLAEYRAALIHECVTGQREVSAATSS